jgi:RecA/RadA recombinase
MLKRRKSGTQKIVDEVVDASKMLKVEKKYIRFDKVVSTGSTLLDLAIAGKKVRGGGLPGGILVEIYGPSGSGKTSLLAEIAHQCNEKGGLFAFVIRNLALTRNTR